MLFVRNHAKWKRKNYHTVVDVKAYFSDKILFFLVNNIWVILIIIPDWNHHAHYVHYLFKTRAGNYSSLDPVTILIVD